jgi:hypothetical protein
MTETFIISTQTAKPLTMSPEDRTAHFKGGWQIIDAALVVTTLRSQDTRLRLVFLPARCPWVWSLSGATDPHDPKWARLSAESLVFLARLLPIHTSATETLEAYFAADGTLRIDIVDASIGSCLAEFASWDDLDRFATSRSAAKRLN